MDNIDKMDNECIDLCEAMNKVKGVKTQASCCGHGEQPFRIWFDCNSMSSLYLMGRVLNKCYGGVVDENGIEWLCQVLDLDIYFKFENNTVVKANPRFKFDSVNVDYDKVVEQSKQIAKNIDFHLDKFPCFKKSDLK